MYTLRRAHSKTWGRVLPTCTAPKPPIDKETSSPMQTATMKRLLGPVAVIGLLAGERDGACG